MLARIWLNNKYRVFSPNKLYCMPLEHLGNTAQVVWDHTLASLLLKLKGSHYSLLLY